MINAKHSQTKLDERNFGPADCGFSSNGCFRFSFVDAKGICCCQESILNRLCLKFFFGIVLQMAIKEELIGEDSEPFKCRSAATASDFELEPAFGCMPLDLKI